MSLTILFLIDLEPAQYSIIVSQLQSSQFEVNSLTYMGDKTPIPSQVFCSKNFLDWPHIVNEQNNLHNIVGVTKIIVFSHEVTNDDKQRWHRHWIFPMLIATVVNIISLLLLVYQLKPDSTPLEYLILTIVPPLLSLGSAVGVKKS